MSKIKLTGSNSGYVEIDSAADAGNLTLTLPTGGTALLSNAGNVFSGITTTGQLDINGSIDVSSTSVFNDDLTLTGASYNVVWDKSDNQLEFGDNAKISFGATADLQIYYDSEGWIKNNASTLNILNDGTTQIKNAADNQTVAQFVTGNTSGTSGCKLYFGNSLKFYTTDTGTVTNGICTATSFSGSGEGLTYTSPLSHRNKFINGSFDIWQRGTSSTSTGYLADRWYFGLSGGSATCSRQEHSGSQANFSGSQYYLRLAVTSSSDYIGIRQRIEDVRTLPEGQITVSFWARGHVNANLAVWMTQNFGSGGSTDVDIAQQVTPYLQNDSTFRYYSLTFTVPSISGKTIGAGSFFQISFGQGTNNSASAWTLDISNIQVEVGSVATPFEHRSVGEEIQRCKRYFQRFTAYGDHHHFGVARAESNTARTGIVIPVPMRAVPTVACNGHRTFAGDAGYNSESTSTPALAYSGAGWVSDSNIYTVDFPGHSLTHNRMYCLMSKTTSTNALTLDSEL